MKFRHFKDISDSGAQNLQNLHDRFPRILETTPFRNSWKA